MSFSNPVDRIVFSSLNKGIPAGIGEITATEIAAARWNVLSEDVPLPAAVLLDSKLRSNGRVMRDFLSSHRLQFSPHGKTSMSPQLFRRQLEDGCWGISLATCHQLQVARHFGFSRIVLANQIVGKAELDYICREIKRDTTFEFYCFVDSTEGVLRIAEAAECHGLERPINVLIEGGFSGGRCGCRSIADAMHVAGSILERQRFVRLAGTAGFEGLYQYRKSEDRAALVTNFLEFLVEIAGAADNMGCFLEAEDIVLSAGGSAYFDLVSKVFNKASLSRPVRIINRSGCYLTHDCSIYEQLQTELLQRGPLTADHAHLQNALEVWAYVLSKPEPETVVISAGRRDFGQDAGNPLPLKLSRPGIGLIPLPKGATVQSVSDQHTCLRVPFNHRIEIGDMIALGVSHPCTTFDKWQSLYVVTDDYDVLDVVRTFF